MDAWARFLLRIGRGTSFLSAFVLVAIMTLTCADVVFRYFGHPIKGVYDITCIAAGIVTFLALAASHANGYHISMDSCFSRPKPLRIAVNAITALLSTGMIGLIAWRCILLGKELWNNGRVSDTIGIPLYPCLYVAAFGLGVYCLVLAIGFLKLPKKTGDSGPSSENGVQL